MIEVRNRKRTAFLTDEQMSILGEPNIEFCGFLNGFVL